MIVSRVIEYGCWLSLFENTIYLVYLLCELETSCLPNGVKVIGWMCWLGTLACQASLACSHKDGHGWVRGHGTDGNQTSSDIRSADGIISLGWRTYLAIKLWHYVAIKYSGKRGQIHDSGSSLGYCCCVCFPGSSNAKLHIQVFILSISTTDQDLQAVNSLPRQCWPEVQSRWSRQRPDWFGIKHRKTTFPNLGIWLANRGIIRPQPDRAVLLDSKYILWLNLSIFFWWLLPCSSSIFTKASSIMALILQRLLLGRD